MTIKFSETFGFREFFDFLIKICYNIYKEEKKNKPIGERKMDNMLMYFAFEEEQQRKKREKIEKVINFLVLAEDPNDFYVQQMIFNQVNLSINDLTKDDIVYIEEEISKRLEEI